MARERKQQLKGPSDNVEFPPVEHLHVVGYFRADIDQPIALARCLLAAVDPVIPTGDPTDMYLGCLRADPPERCREQWTYRSDTQVYSFDAKEADPTPYFLRGGPLGEPKRLVHLGVGRQGRQSRRMHAFNRVWEVDIEGEERYPNVQRDCLSMVSVSTDRFPMDDMTRPIPSGVGVAPPVSTALVDRVITTWLDYGPLYYALATSAWVFEDGGGWCYRMGGPSDYSSVQFRIEQELWEEAREARRDKVRGVHPAQYLSPQHLEKLGGKDRFIAEFLSRRDGALNDPSRRRDYMTDLGERGLILRIAPTPIDASTRGLNVGFAQLASWLFRRFRDAGLLL